MGVEVSKDVVRVAQAFMEMVKRGAVTLDTTALRGNVNIADKKVGVFARYSDG